MISKRGQITVFIILGLAILLLTAGLFFILSKGKKAPLEVEEEEAYKFLWVRPALQGFVQGCIEETADPSLYLLVKQGGIIYPDVDNKILLTDFGLINYAWINGVKGLSKDKMEFDLGLYLVDNIGFCLGDFRTFEKQNIVVTPNYDLMRAEVIIQNTLIDVQLKFPLKITLPNGDELVVDSFSTKVRSSLGLMLQAVESLEFPDIDIPSLHQLPYRTLMFPYDESVTIYSLTQTNPREPLIFMFAVRNDYPVNEPPTLDYIADKTFTIGDIWQDEITATDANNDILQYSSDSSQFPISSDGFLDVQLTTAGIFDITFIVEDGRGGEDEQEVSILVLE